MRRSSGTKCRIETQHGRPQPGLDTPLRVYSTDGCYSLGLRAKPASFLLTAIAGQHLGLEIADIG